MYRKVNMFMVIASAVCITLIGGLSQVLAEESSSITTADLKTLIEQYEAEGEFTNEDAPRALKAHFTAIGHFKKRGAMDNVLSTFHSNRASKTFINCDILQRNQAPVDLQ